MMLVVVHYIKAKQSNVMTDISPNYLRPQVGLAVDDIKAIQEQAVLKRLALQVSNMQLIS